MKEINLTDIDHEDFRRLLMEIGHTFMPFGKFGPKDYPPRGIPIMDLPPEYLGWFRERGYPKGRLGELMEMVCVIKESGMDEVFQPLRKHLHGGRTSIRKRKKNTNFSDL